MYLKCNLVIDVSEKDLEKIDLDEVAEAVRDRLSRERVDASVEGWPVSGRGGK
jgi:hypothetical protein